MRVVSARREPAIAHFRGGSSSGEVFYKIDETWGSELVHEKTQGDVRNTGGGV